MGWDGPKLHRRLRTFSFVPRAPFLQVSNRPALQAAMYPYRTATALIRFRNRKFPVESRGRSLASSVALTSAVCDALNCGVGVGVGVLLLL